MDTNLPTTVPATESRVHLGEMLRRVRRGEHITIDNFDLPIAATALRFGLALVARNTSDFQRSAGFQLYPAP